MSSLPPLTGEFAAIFCTVCFDEAGQVFRHNTVASPQTYGIKPALSNVVIYGQGMNLKNFGYLFWGE
jgi:hypothetical protein